MNPPLNRRVLVWGVSASVLEAGLFVWPLHVVLMAGQNADLAVVAALGWGLLVITVTPHRRPSGPISPRVFFGLDALALVGLWGLDGLLLNQLASMLQTFFYFDTPRCALVIPLMILIAWGVHRGPQVVWHVATLWVPALFGLSFAMFLLALVNVHHLRPALPNQVILIPPLVRGVGILAYMGLPLGVTLRHLLPRLDSPVSWSLRSSAIGLPWLFLAMIYVLVVGSVGPDAMATLRWPVVFALDHVTLDSTFFLSRVGIVVIFAWTVGVALGIMVHLRLTQAVLLPAAPPRAWILTGVLLSTMAGIALGITSPDVSSAILVHDLNPGCEAFLALELLTVSVVHLAMRRAPSAARHQSSR